MHDAAIRVSIKSARILPRLTRFVITRSSSCSIDVVFGATNIVKFQVFGITESIVNDKNELE